MRLSNQLIIATFLACFVRTSMSFAAQEIATSPSSPPYSRWALSAEFTPGVGYSLKDGGRLPSSFPPSLGGAVMGSYYFLDQCAPPSQKSCFQLPLHLRFSTNHYLEGKSASQLGLAPALEPTFFFGKQRIVGFTVFASVGYYYTWFREPSDEANTIYSPHAVRFFVGLGCVFNLQAATKGLQIYIRAETSTHLEIAVPIGLRYRF